MKLESKLLLPQITYLGVAHRCHDTVGTGIKSALDHPLLGARNSNNGADSLGADGVIEL